MTKENIFHANDIRKQYRRNQKFRFVVQLLGVLLGSIINGMAFRTFFKPVNIISSGMSGISQLISFGIFKNYDYTTLIYLFINVILFIFALKLFGWKFIVFSLVGIAGYTVAMQYFVIPGLGQTEDLLLYSLIGGGLAGLGQGIAFRMDGSTGGSDIAAKIINKFFPKIKTGVAVLMINVVVITITVLTMGWQTGLYAIIIALISTITCDMVLDGVKTVRAFYIITDYEEEVGEKILQHFHRGVTILPVKGAFSGKEKRMLLCLVANSQAREMKEIIKDIDKNAFVFSTAVNETLGDGYFLREASVRKNKIASAKSGLKTATDIKRMKKRPKANFGKRFKKAI